MHAFVTAFAYKLIALLGGYRSKRGTPDEICCTLARAGKTGILQGSSTRRCHCHRRRLGEVSEVSERYAGRGPHKNSEGGGQTLPHDFPTTLHGQEFNIVGS